MWQPVIRIPHASKQVPRLPGVDDRIRLIRIWVAVARARRAISRLENYAIIVARSGARGVDIERQPGSLAAVPGCHIGAVLERREIGQFCSSPICIAKLDAAVAL